MSANNNSNNRHFLAAADNQPSNCWFLRTLPRELHVNILTYLRAYDLASSVQLVCRAMAHAELTHAIVQHTAQHVYPTELTSGFDTPPVAGHAAIVTTTAATATRDGSRDGQGRAAVVPPRLYTYEHLKSMELLVVARVLSRPEPSSKSAHGGASGGGGFYVSKSWCKAALAWLEVQQESLHRHRSSTTNSTSNATTASSSSKRSKKKLKKQQRMRNRRLSDASPPWPNVNSDLLCPHDNLQPHHCGAAGGGSSTRASRAKRKVLDRQAWRVLKKLYPDSNTLQTVEGECLICRMEEETRKKTQADELQRQRLERKKPLSCPLVRGFYTRSSRGVPLSSLVGHDDDDDGHDDNGSPTTSSAKMPACRTPLKPGVYHVLPRSWCYKWRRYIKSGSTSSNGGGETSDIQLPPPAPCASELLCHAHRLPLIPPHLESYLYGETCHLLGTTTTASGGRGVEQAGLRSPPPARGAAAFIPPTVGVAPDADTVRALRAAGLSPSEVASQRMAMLNLEQQQQQQQPPFAAAAAAVAVPNAAGRGFVAARRPQHPTSTTTTTRGDQLDRENSVVVEILTNDEWVALQSWWPKVHSNYSLSFTVQDCDRACGDDENMSGGGGGGQRRGGSISWSVAPCRDCDASGQYCRLSDLHVKNRARGWVKKSCDKKRAPASLEY